VLFFRWRWKSDAAQMERRGRSASFVGGFERWRGWARARYVSCGNGKNQAGFDFFVLFFVFWAGGPPSTTTFLYSHRPACVQHHLLRAAGGAAENPGSMSIGCFHETGAILRERSRGSIAHCRLYRLPAQSAMAAESLRAFPRGGSVGKVANVQPIDPVKPQRSGEKV